MDTINIPTIPFGQKLVVRHKANGDTEYLLRTDIENGQFLFSLLSDGGRLLATILFVGILGILFFFFSSQREENLPQLPSKTKIEVRN